MIRAHERHTLETTYRMKNEPSKLLRACELVLLFHDGGPWTYDKAQAWANGLTDIMGPAISRSDLPSNEATTKNLCNAIRVAVADFTGNPTIPKIP